MFGQRLSFVLAACSWLLFASVVEGQPFVILEYERLPELTLNQRANVQGMQAKVSSARETRFEAFGRRFDLLLEDNSRLLANLTSEQRRAFAGIELYRGTLAGVPGSWVRLASSEGDVRGVIWDGAELYGIDSYATAVPFLSDPDATDDQRSPIIYRSSDTKGSLLDRVFHPVEPLAGDSNTEAFKAHLTRTLAAIVSPAKQLDIGVVSDSALWQNLRANTGPQLIAAINAVDGFFLEQAGIHLNIAELQVFDEVTTDPFSTAEPDLLLDQLMTHKEDLPALREQGLVHLFTGRDLVEPPGYPSGAQVVGYAVLGSLCDARFSTSITQATLGSLETALIAAHEIGHNFGAPHDAEAGSPCASTPSGYIMAPQLNAATSFSQCSLNQMEPEITAATCLKNIPANDVSVSLRADAPDTVGQTEYFDVWFAIYNSIGSTTFDIRVEVEVRGLQLITIYLPGCMSEWNTVSETDLLVCSIGALAAHSTEWLRVYVAAEEPGNGQITVSASAVSDPNLSNNSLTHEVSVVPSIRLDHFISNVDQGYVRPGGTASLRAVIDNDGPITATDIDTHVEIGPNIELVSITQSGGSCAAVPGTSAWSCPIPALEVDSAQILDIVVRAMTGLPYGSYGEITVKAEAAQVNISSLESARGAINITDLADVGISVAGPTEIPGDADAQFTIVADNHGPDPAVQVYVFFAATPFRIKTITTDLGTCRITAGPTMDGTMCSIDQWPPGQRVTITLSGNPTSESLDGIYARIDSSIAVDLIQENNQYSHSLVVTSSIPTPGAGAGGSGPKPPATSGGGGGSITWLALWALMLLNAVRSRNSAKALLRHRRSCHY